MQARFFEAEGSCLTVLRQRTLVAPPAGKGTPVARIEEGRLGLRIHRAWRWVTGERSAPRSCAGRAGTVELGEARRATLTRSATATAGVLEGGRRLLG